MSCGASTAVSLLVWGPYSLPAEGAAAPDDAVSAARKAAGDFKRAEVATRVRKPKALKAIAAGAQQDGVQFKQALTSWLAMGA